jgi:hypothetical protein
VVMMEPDFLQSFLYSPCIIEVSGNVVAGLLVCASDRVLVVRRFRTGQKCIVKDWQVLKTSSPSRTKGATGTPVNSTFQSKSPCLAPNGAHLEDAKDHGTRERPSSTTVLSSFISDLGKSSKREVWLR